MMRSFLATLTRSVFGSALVDNARAARKILALTGALLLALPVLRLACGGPTWDEMFATAQLVVPATAKALTPAGLNLLTFAWRAARCPRADAHVRMREVRG